MNSSTNSNTAPGSNLNSDEQAANAAITAAAKNALNSKNAASANSNAAATVASTIASNSNLSTFNSLIQTAGLNSILTSPGPITVFAPTDAAFAKLPAGTVANWQKPENKTELRRVLSYHISNGKLASADLAKSASQQTLAGLAITASSNGSKINNAQVASADISASNGIIHTIDTVLMPSAASVPTN
ncbi:MAG: fasciclin domain-containing protein [Alphaproteobacteria bacterium]|nr:MAG: fasciclin domain-containing protein [Alphaproteobacteria bacterium]